MKYLTVVLTSNDIYACERAVASFPETANVVIVCNTQDKDYFNQLTKSHLAEKYVILKTESNGTPGRGKQSVYDYFLCSDYEYLIHIDGDDFLYPEGYDIICNYVDERSPDVLGLLGEDVMVDDKIFSDWRNLDLSTFVQPSDIMDPVQVRQYFVDVFRLINQEYCPFHRIVCINKKAARLVQWNEQLSGTEDVLLSAQLKMLHINRELEYHLIETPDVYLYRKLTDGGTSLDVLMSDPDVTREIFFKHFTEEDVNKLRNNWMHYTKIDEKSSKFARMKYAKRTVKQFDANRK